MEEMILYEKNNPKMRLAVLEFLENSEACAIAQISADHLDKIFLATICVENERVVGLCALTQNKYMNSELILAVREGAQGRGIASRIQTKLLEKAFSRQLSISLTTYDTVTYRHVIKFYEKFGFILLRKYKNKVLYGHETNRLIFNIKRQFTFYYVELGRECKAWIRNFSK